MVGPVGWAQHEKKQGVDLTNLSEAPIENIQEKKRLTNLSGAKENAASTGMDHGVKTIETVKKSQMEHTLKLGRSAMSKWGKPAHKSIAKALGFALTLGTETAWRGFTIVLLARLSEQERAALAFSTLNSLDHDNAYMAASVALFGVLDGEVLA